MSAVHEIKAKEHEKSRCGKSASCRRTLLQGCIDYFVVVDEENGELGEQLGLYVINRAEKELFENPGYWRFKVGKGRGDLELVQAATEEELDAGSENAADPDLVRILVAAEAVLRDAYRLCSDTSQTGK
ncbi:hypothetical protein B0O99DRAFT_696816 [Bisporella sp. PMI_857]|nr:hypothetical protein B0O99DRAFT_696816 [Bisporella sp. PMI_857]